MNKCHMDGFGEGIVSLHIELVSVRGSTYPGPLVNREGWPFPSSQVLSP